MLDNFNRKDVSPLAYWVHAILPLVYDDSLSYYEVLAKVSQKMNEVIQGLNSNNAQVEKVTNFTKEQVENLTLAFNNFQASMLERQENFETKILDDQHSFETRLLGDIAEWESTTEEKFNQQYQKFLRDYQKQFGVVQNFGGSTELVGSQNLITTSTNSILYTPINTYPTWDNNNHTLTFPLHSFIQIGNRTYGTPDIGDNRTLNLSEFTTNGTSGLNAIRVCINPNNIKDYTAVNWHHNPPDGYVTLCFVFNDNVLIPHFPVRIKYLQKLGDDTNSAVSQNLITTSTNSILYTPINTYPTWDNNNHTLTFPLHSFIQIGNRTYGTPDIGDNRTLNLSEFTTNGTSGLNAIRVCINPNNIKDYTAVNWHHNPPDGYVTLCFVFNDNVLMNGNKLVINEKKRSIAFFGDSITAGTGASTLYHMIISDKYHVHCYNWGVGSTGFKEQASNVSVTVGDGVEGKGITKTVNGNNTVIDIMKSTTFDRCSIFAGTNDWRANIQLSDFQTAVEKTLDYALTKTSKVCVLLPIHRGNNNNLNLTISDYNKIIAKACDDRAIPYINGLDIPLNPNIPSNKSTFFSDTVHPNNTGHNRIAIAYEKMIEYILV